MFSTVRNVFFSCICFQIHMQMNNRIHDLTHDFIIYLQKRTVTLIPGDGIGPEISSSVQKIFAAADVRQSFVFSIRFSNRL